MNLYPLLSKLLFLLDPEDSHDLSLDWLSASNRLHLLRHMVGQVPAEPVELMGITFPNPVGLAAGLDKNADHLDAMATLGFGFVEVGTVTPRPQPGNEKPRLFRLEDSKAIINRMGFNNKGVEHLIERVERSRASCPIGINIGKNLTTPVEQANNDYLSAMRSVYRLASYITVNVSSPNTPGLRTLQFGDSLKELMEAVKKEQADLAKRHERYVPVVIKIAPDMDEQELELFASTAKSFEIDGIIATNTTLDKSMVAGRAFADEAGGLSGSPLTQRSISVIQQLRATLGEDYPLISVGGTMTGQDAADKIAAGADLVQLYTGFIYGGPRLIKDCVESISSLRHPLEKHSSDSRAV